MSRWQVTFRREEATRWISHLDLLRTWERAFCRAGLRLARSHGFRPHPKIGIAAPLPVGVLGRAELLDVTLEDEPGASEVASRISAQLPDGLALRGLAPLEGPPLAARVCQAVYCTTFPTMPHPPELNARIGALLSAGSLHYERKREQGTREIDLRPLIHDLWLEHTSPLAIGMRLALTSKGAGRADEVIEVLGMSTVDALIERTELVLVSR